MSRGKVEAVLIWLLAAAMIVAAIGLIVNYSRRGPAHPQPVAAAAVDNDGCLTCHGDPNYQPKTTTRSWSQLYANPAVLAGSVHKSITCTSCHTTSDTGTPIDKAAAQAICGDCHKEELKQVQASIHSDVKVTNCISCHSDGGSAHAIQPVLSPKSAVFVKNVPQTCGSCHSDKRLMAKYGLDAEVYDVYMESPHAKVLKLTGKDNDGLKPAVCTTCHGSHNVRAWNDPKSPVKDDKSKSQVCAGCHNGANTNFGDALSIHQAPTAGGSPGPFYGERFFFLLTASTVSFGLLLLVLGGFGWFYRKTAPEMETAPGLVTSSSGEAAILGTWPGPASLPAPRPRIEPQVQAAAVSAAVPEQIDRFDTHQRLQHFIMMGSFILLALTGLPQKFPDWGISQTMITFWGGLEAARTIHRFAGLLMMTDCAYHLGYIAYNTLVLKKQPPIAMIPSPKDVLDLFQHMRYWFGRTEERPRFGRFSYLEKFDYWAIFWGMPVIGMSGLVMMFPVVVSKLLPGQFIQVSFIAHSDEAVLAVLWIFLVHFFFVHINPRFFPLNKAIFTGKMPREVYAEEHPLELEQIEKRARRQAARRQQVTGEGDK